MTVDELNRIHAALEETGGDRALAAIKLRMTPRDLHDAIKQNRGLKERWVVRQYRPTDQVGTPVTEAEALHKPPQLPAPPPAIDKVLADAGVTQTEADMVASMIAEDALLRRGLQGLGLTDAEKEIAAELAKFHKEHFVRSIDIIGAGVTRTSIKIQTQLDNVNADLAAIREKLNANGGLVGEARIGPCIERDQLLRHFTALADQLRRTYEAAYKAALIHAMVARSMRGIGKKRKPGYNHHEPEQDAGTPEPAISC